MTPDRLSRRALVPYSVGAVGPSIVFALQGLFLLYFLTDVALIPAATVTVALALGRVWDILNDPLVGWVSDRTVSRLGRRRPYMLWGAVPLAVSTYFMFAIPRGLTGSWAVLVVFGAFFFWDLALTVVHVPFVALGAEMTTVYDGRTRVVAYGAAGAVLGYLLGGVGTPTLVSFFTSDVAGYRVAGAFCGIIAGATAAGAAWKMTEVKRVPTTLSIRRTTKVILTNRPFRVLVISLALVSFAFTAATAALPYFVAHQLLAGEQFTGALVFELLGVVALGIPVWRWISVRTTKHEAYAYGLGLMSAALAAVLLIPPHGIIAAFVLVAFIGFGNAAHWVLPWSMIPDAVDVSDAGDSVGTHFGVYGVVEKVAGSVSIVAMGGALALFGYRGGVDPSHIAVLGIRLLVGPIPAMFVAGAALVMRRYPIETHRNPRPARSVEPDPGLGV